MLQAMNTGHDGSLTTLHANTPRDAIARLETMVLMAGMDLPVRAIRDQIASAVHLIVQQTRFSDGTRKVTSITEVTGIDGDQVTDAGHLLLQAGRVRRQGQGGRPSRADRLHPALLRAPSPARHSARLDDLPVRGGVSDESHGTCPLRARGRCHRRVGVDELVGGRWRLRGLPQGIRRGGRDHARPGVLRPSRPSGSSR